jgi:hypothetical protein
MKKFFILFSVFCVVLFSCSNNSNSYNPLDGFTQAISIVGDVDETTGKTTIKLVDNASTGRWVTDTTSINFQGLTGGLIVQIRDITDVESEYDGPFINVIVNADSTATFETVEGRNYLLSVIYFLREPITNGDTGQIVDFRFSPTGNTTLGLNLYFNPAWEYQTVNEDFEIIDATRPAVHIIGIINGVSYYLTDEDEPADFLDHDTIDYDGPEGAEIYYNTNILDRINKSVLIDIGDVFDNDGFLK